MYNLKNNLFKLGKTNRLVIMSDIHIGAESFDEKHFLEALRFVEKEKYKLVLNGDICEISIIEGKAPGEKLLEQTMLPTEQIQYAISKFSSIARRGDLLFLTRGNHCARLRREALVDICAIIADRLGCGYAGIGGYVRLVAGKHIYTGAIQHGRSTSPNTWGELDKMIKLYPDAEFVVLGHDHQLAHRPCAFLGVGQNGKEVVRQRFQVRSGTYLSYADYARNMCLPPGEVGSPILEFNEKSHKIKVDTSTLSWIST